MTSLGADPHARPSARPPLGHPSRAPAQVYWGGGSANYTVSSLDWSLLSDGPERFEDGTLCAGARCHAWLCIACPPACTCLPQPTCPPARPPTHLPAGTLPFLDIIGLRHGLRVFDTLGGPAAIEEHTAALGRYLYEQAARLRHSNGAPLLQIYGNHARPDRCGGRVGPAWGGGAARVAAVMAHPADTVLPASSSLPVRLTRVPLAPPALQRQAPGLHADLQPAGPVGGVPQLAGGRSGHDGGRPARAVRRHVQPWRAVHVHG